MNTGDRKRAERFGRAVLEGGFAADQLGDLAALDEDDLVGLGGLAGGGEVGAAGDDGAAVAAVMGAVGEDVVHGDFADGGGAADGADGDAFVAEDEDEADARVGVAAGSLDAVAE